MSSNGKTLDFDSSKGCSIQPILVIKGIRVTGIEPVTEWLKVIHSTDWVKLSYDSFMNVKFTYKIGQTAIGEVKMIANCLALLVP